MSELLQYLAHLGTFTGLFLDFISLSSLLLGALLLQPIWLAGRRLSIGTTRLGADRDPIAQTPFPPNTDLARLWAAFVRRAHSIPAEIRPGQTQARFLVDPAEVFSLESVAGRMNLRLAEAVPGALTALGILGTFFGILIGLSSLELGNPEGTMSSIQGLLGGMTTAFATSVWGITLSLCWLLFFRVLRNRLDLAVTGFAQRVAEHYPPLRPEEILSAMLFLGLRQEKVSGEIRASIDSQKAELQRVGSDISETLERTLNTAYEKHFTPAVDSLRSTMEGFSSKVAERETAALGDMVESLREKLSGAVRDEYESLSESMMTAAELQEATTSSLSTLLERVEKTSTGQIELIEATSLASDKFARSTDHLTEAQRAINETSGHLQRLVDAAGNLAAEARAQAEVLTGAHDELRQRLADQLDQIRGQVDELRGFWLQLEEPLGALSSQLRDSMQEFTQFTAEKLGEVFSRFDSEMAQVVDHLSGSLAEIRESTLDLAPSTGRLETTLEGAVERFEGLELAIREFVAASEQLRQSTGELSGHMPAHRTAITQVSAGLDRLTTALPTLVETVRAGRDGHVVDPHQAPRIEPS